MSVTWYPLTTTVTTTTEDYDLLQDAEIKAQLQARHGWDEAKYQAEIANGFTGLFFEIFTSDTTLKINDGIYQELVANSVYSTEDYIQLPIKSIKIKDSGITLTVSLSRN